MSLTAGQPKPADGAPVATERRRVCFDIDGFCFDCFETWSKTLESVELKMHISISGIYCL